MTTTDQITAIREKLVSLASDLRAIKNDTGNENADQAVENAEDAADEAVRHLGAALDDLTYA